MCGRFNNSNLTQAQMRGVIDAFVENTAISFNVKPTQSVPILYRDGADWVGASARWWLIPHWHKGDVKDWKATTFNAKYEEAANKPSFREAWHYGRCLIPMNGYFEWTGEKGAKRPWYIEPQSNSGKLFFAGLYSRWQDEMTCTILTRAASAQISHLHPRMPIIPNDTEIDPWLGGENLPELGTSTQFQAHRVKKFGMKDDGADLIEPFEEAT